MSGRYVLLQATDAAGITITTVWDTRLERVVARHVGGPRQRRIEAALVARRWLTYRVGWVVSADLALAMQRPGVDVALLATDEPIVKVRCSCPGTTVHHPSCCLQGVDLNA